MLRLQMPESPTDAPWPQQETPEILYAHIQIQTAKKLYSYEELVFHSQNDGLVSKAFFMCLDSGFSLRPGNHTLLQLLSF
jgi:hypothetical protein